MSKLQRRQDKGQEHHHRLGNDNDFAPGKLLDNYTREGRQKQRRNTLCAGNKAQRQFRFSQIVHDNLLRNSLHPCAGYRYQLTRKIQPES